MARPPKAKAPRPPRQKNLEMRKVRGLLHDAREVRFLTVVPSPAALQVLAQVRKLIGHFNHSSTNAEELLETAPSDEGAAVGDKSRLQVADVATRWSATFGSLSRFWATSAFLREYHQSRIERMKPGAAKRRAVNPILPELVTCIGDALGVLGDVFFLVNTEQANERLLIRSTEAILALARPRDSFQIPIEPNKPLAIGPKQMADYLDKQPDMLHKTIVIDNRLFKTEQKSLAVGAQRVRRTTYVPAPRTPSSHSRTRTAAPALPARRPQALAAPVRALTAELTKQLDQRFFNKDPASHKNLLLDPSVLRQLLLVPGASKHVIKKWAEVADDPTITPKRMLDEGVKSLHELFDRFDPMLSVAPAAAAAPSTSAVTAAPRPRARASLSFDYGPEDATDESSSAPTPAPESRSALARKELAAFIEIIDVSFIKQGDLERVLPWWAEHKQTYPLLYVTAMSVFGAFPVSAEAERQFSTAGKDMTASRSGMSPVLLRMLTLLRLNIDTVNEATKGDCAGIVQQSGANRAKIRNAIEDLFMPPPEHDDTYDPSANEFE